MTETNITKVTFDLVSSLILIGSDDALLSMYNGKFNIDIKIAIINAKKGIKSDSDSFVKGIFNNIIMKRKEYLDEYIKIFLNTSSNNLKIKKYNSTRRYGKQQILSDVKTNGGKPTEVQRMLLEVNDLKNIVAKLNRKGKAQNEGYKYTLTDKQCREIIGTIQILKNKLKNIL